MSDVTKVDGSECSLCHRSTKNLWDLTIYGNGLKGICSRCAMRRLVISMELLSKDNPREAIARNERITTLGIIRPNK